MFMTLAMRILFVALFALFAGFTRFSGHLIDRK